MIQQSPPPMQNLTELALENELCHEDDTGRSLNRLLIRDDLRHKDTTVSMDALVKSPL